MSTATTASTITPDAAQQQPPKTGTPAAPVLITEQEVLFGTRVATSAGRLSFSRRVIDAVRGATHALHLPPPHEHYPADLGYLEHSRMAREMDRL
jgi:hypothetical protein